MSATVGECLTIVSLPLESDSVRVTAGLSSSTVCTLVASYCSPLVSQIPSRSRTISRGT